MDQNKPVYIFADNEQQLKQDTNFAAQSDDALLLLGASGTGKTLLAEFIHERSSRAKGPFRAINCGAIPDELVESELFGYEKGAFTGANAQRAGVVAQAEGGTLFLDEIDKASRTFQYKLLTFLQNRKYSPLGSKADVTANVRVIFASQATPETAPGLPGDALMRRLQGVPPIQLPSARSNPSKCWHLFRRNIEIHAQGRIIQQVEFPLWVFVVCYMWPRNFSEIADFAKDLILRRECLRDGVLRMDPILRFFDTTHPLPYPKETITSPFSSMATGDQLTEALRVSLDSWRPGPSGEFEQGQVYRNGAQREFCETLRMMQRDDSLGDRSLGVVDEKYLRLFPNRHPWADLSKGVAVEDGRWAYPPRAWSDPLLTDESACRWMSEMYAAVRLGIMESDPTQRLTERTPWHLSPGHTSGRPHVDVEALAEMTGRAIETVVSTGSATRDEFLRKAYRSIVMRNPSASDRELASKGIPEGQVKELRSAVSPQIAAKKAT